MHPCLAIFRDPMSSCTHTSVTTRFPLKVCSWLSYNNTYSDSSTICLFLLNKSLKLILIYHPNSSFSICSSLSVDLSLFKRAIFLTTLACNSVLMSFIHVMGET
ncbi:hypothetical protein GEMRC1_000822 [Eukaryota sp. GEM-RC1]